MPDRNRSGRREQEPLRVLIAAPANSVGGQAQAARDIFEGLDGLQDVSAMLVAIDPRLSGALGFLTEWKLLRSVVRPLLYLYALVRAVPKVDVVHAFGAAHLAFFFGAVPAIVVAGLLRRPVVLNYHDGRAEKHFSWWGWVLRWAVRHSAAIVFPSGYLQAIFAAHGIDGIVVPNVVNTSVFTFSVHDPIPHRLISARLLEPLYGVENTIRAFARVRECVPGVVLEVYGSGSAERSLRRQAADVAGVRFYGPVPHRDMPRVLARGGVLVNSSRIDNTPHVIIEAFAAGLPIVTTPAGGITHMVEHDRTGVVVPFDDPDAMAAGVLRVLEEPGLAARLARAGRRACNAYTWDVACRGWRRVYRQAISGVTADDMAVEREIRCSSNSASSAS